MIRIASGLAATLALTLLAGCPGEDPLTGVCGSGFNAETGAVGDFGTSAAALKVEAFLTASGDLIGAADAIAADALAACTAIATDLGIPAGELAPTGAELEVTATCGRVAEEIDAIVATLPTGVALGLSITPPACSVDLDLAATCAADCDVTIEGTAEVSCDGELRGSCTGSCTGTCTASGTVACTGACSGTCTGSCSGTCTGTCTGTCSLEDDAGNCIGTCTGTCEGTCDAACEGSCAGACTATVTATCEGECRGECDVAWEAECNGSADVTADADCKAACDVSANASVVCADPDVTVVGLNLGDPTAQARLDLLVATLIENYPALVAVQTRAGYAFASVDEFAGAVQGAADSLADVGLQAAACLAAAGEAVATAAGTLEASVTITVEVSASVSAEGSAN